MAQSVTFKPVAATVISPGEQMVVTWLYGSFPLALKIYATTVLGEQLVVDWTDDGSGLPDTFDSIVLEDGFTGFFGYTAGPTWIGFQSAGGWDGQDGTLSIRVVATNTPDGTDTFTASYTLDETLPPPKLDHTSEALGRLIDQFDGSVSVRSLASSYVDQAQAFENVAHQLLAGRRIDIAVGDRLDGLGQIVNVPRSGRGDDYYEAVSFDQRSSYRLRIRAELAVLLSQGSVEDLIAVLRLLIGTGTSPDFELVEYYPKMLYTRPIDYVLTEDPTVIGTMLKRAVSAATQLWFVYSEQLDASTFTLSSQGAATESSSSLGLADVSQTSGGHLSGVA